MIFRMSLLFAATSLVACTSQGWYTAPGVQCDPASFKQLTPTVASVPATTKTVNLPGTHASGPTLPPGDYKYTSFDMYYNGASPSPGVEPLMFQLHQEAQADGNTPDNTGVACVRATPATPIVAQSFEVIVPDEIIVGADKSVSYVPRVLGMNTRSDKFQGDPVLVGEKQISVKDISQIFGEQTPLNQVILVNPTGDDPNHYEIIADYQCHPPEQEACTYSVVAHYHWDAPSANPMADEAARWLRHIPFRKK